MVPGTWKLAPLGSVRGRCRPQPMRRTRRPARPGLVPRPWSVTAAIAMALVLSAPDPGAARQGSPLPDESRASVERHAARRAALERQRRGDAAAGGVQGAPGWAWPVGVCAPPAWGWSYRAPWEWWHRTSEAWSGIALCGRGHGALWGRAPGHASRGWAPWASLWGWGYGIGPRRGRSYRLGPEWPGRHAWPGDRVWLRIDVPYDWPWGWPYVPLHRFDGRYAEDWWRTPSPWPSAPAPGRPPVAGAHGVEPGRAADCAFVVIEVMYGGTFSGWIAPSRFGTEDLRELEIAIDALFAEGHSLLLMAPDGYAVRVPAGLPIEAIRVGPCSTTQ